MVREGQRRVAVHQASECVGAAGPVGAAGAVGLSLKGQWVSGPHSEYFILLPLVVVHK